MADIKVNPEELEGMGNEVVGYSEEISDILSKLQSKVDQICDAWDGLAQDAFLASYEEMKEALNTFPEIVNGIGQQTIGAAQAFAATDEGLQSSFNGK